MRFSKYNAEGYHDLTAYGAFRNIDREQKQEKQAVRQLRANFAVYRPIVYICSPYAGDRYTAGLRCRKTACPLRRTCCFRSSWTTLIRRSGSRRCS